MGKPIEFPDYDEIVIRNKEIYLDSIIERYGEENRELLSKRFDEQNLYFFETPERLTDYIEYRTEDELILETINFLKELGFSEESIFSKDGVIKSNNKAISSKISALFGNYQRLDVEHISYDFGIFSFLERNCSKESLEHLRKEFLKNFNYFEYLTYSKNKEKINKKYSKVAELAEQHLDGVLGKYSELFEHIETIRKNDFSSYNNCLKNFFYKCKGYLCAADRAKIEASVNSPEPFYFGQLKGYKLLLKYVYSNAESPFIGPKMDFLFDPGLIESFDEAVSKKFLESDSESKKTINEKRLKCLSLAGFDFSPLIEKYDLSSVDIASIPELEPYLPSQYIIDEIKRLREELKYNTAKDILSRYVINSYLNRALIGDYVTDNIMASKSLNFTCINFERDFENNKINALSSNIFLCPVCSFYDRFDVVMDHEYTHALETTYYSPYEGCLVAKCGISLNIFYKNGKKVTKYNNLNEAITQMLAVDSTLKRYGKNQYIFEKPNNIGEIQESSMYASYVPKARALVEFLPSEFIKRRIETTVDFIYEYYDEETWDQLDKMIADDRVSLEDFISYMQIERKKSL